ncbi:MAG: endonuclease/exonuclease/phosphatase family protein [Treponema sp.]|jgi:endonuclease/exonuclease/phosphatase family metal-dependent hydrolase|nr:endonuclease/exonuclease/phosphatase family protein [Treponema sp.]
MKKIIKRIASITGIVIGSVILLAAGFIGILTITEYRPAEIEKMEIQYHAGSAAQPSGATVPVLSRPSRGVPFSLLSWNIGYASLDESQDFFMDGGKGIRPPNDTNVRRNLAGIRDFISGTDFEVLLIQEIDIASRRSYYIDQREYLTERFSGTSVYANNFRCILVPIPFPEVIGRVDSGLLTMNRFETTEALRMSLPNPFSWPIRAANLKRCLLVSRIPLAGTGNAELVIVNLHLEAYDSSGGREAQTSALLDFLYQEYAKGNYCIAGGDFNQNFPGIDPVRFAVKNSDYFIPGALKPSALAQGWQFVADTQTPSCRLLNEPYSHNREETQLYVIDGFILSPNVELLSVETFDLDFKYSDHNPVKMRVLLK